jgi:hypothetical protein
MCPRFAREARRSYCPVDHWRTVKHRDAEKRPLEHALGNIERVLAHDSIGRRHDALSQPGASPHLGSTSPRILRRQLGPIGQSVGRHSGNIGYHMETSNKRQTHGLEDAKLHRRIEKP